VVRCVVADDVEDRDLRAACVVKVGEPIGKAWSKMQQGACGLPGHAAIPICGARDHTFKQAENTAHSRDAVERGDEMHFRRSRIRKADIDTACHQCPGQAFGSVHFFSFADLGQRAFESIGRLGPTAIRDILSKAKASSSKGVEISDRMMHCGRDDEWCRQGSDYSTG
jgi:hypothetical protein